MKKILFILLLIISFLPAKSDDMKVIKPKAYPEDFKFMPLDFPMMIDDTTFCAFGQSKKFVDNPKFVMPFFNYIALFDNNFNIIKINKHKRKHTGLPLYPYNRTASMYRNGDGYKFRGLAYVGFAGMTYHICKEDYNSELDSTYADHTGPILKKTYTTARLFHSPNEFYFYGGYNDGHPNYKGGANRCYIAKIDSNGKEVFHKYFTPDFSEYKEPCTFKTTDLNAQLQIDNEGNIYAIEKLFTKIKKPDIIYYVVVRPHGIKFDKNGDSLIYKPLDTLKYTSDQEEGNFLASYSMDGKKLLLDKDRNRIYAYSQVNRTTFDLHYFDTNWDLVWRKRIKLDSIYKGDLYYIDFADSRSMLIANNGDLLVSVRGRTKAPVDEPTDIENDRGFIFRIDPNGDVLWFKGLKLNDNDSLNTFSGPMFKNSKGEYFAMYMTYSFNASVGGFVTQQSIIVKFTDNFSSVEEPQILSQNMQIAPMPVSNFFNVKFTLDKPGTATIKLYNQAGEIVLTAEHNALSAGEQNAQINAANLPAGGYICHIKSGNQVITQQFIKQ